MSTIDHTNPSADAPAPSAVGGQDWHVRLSSFEGPLDLLLFLIRRAEVDIHDIPIAEITEQYFEYIGQLWNAPSRQSAPRGARVDIDLAGEFLVMAATLIEIKSRTLAPKPEGESTDSELLRPEAGEDPRADLVRQLLAYQRYRSAAEELDRLRGEFAARWETKVASDGPAEAEVTEIEIELEDAHVLDLLETYERIIGAIDLGRLGDHRVEYDDTPISLHQTDLVDRLNRAPERRLSLRDVIEGRTRGEAIGLFLAMLELARQGAISIASDDVGSDIRIALRESSDDASG